jgi:HEAT repeat protein
LRRHHSAIFLSARRNRLPAVLRFTTQALKGSDQSLAADAAGALWRVDRKNRDAIPTLISILEKSKDVTPRATAAHVLGQIGPPAKAAVPALTRTLQDPFMNVRLVAAEALWVVDRPDHIAILALIELLKDRDEFLAGQAALTLSRAGADAREAIPALKDVLKANNSVSVSAAEALWKLEPGNKETMPALARALKSGNRLARLGAAEAITRLGADAREVVPALVETLKDEDETVRESAADALQEIDPKSAGKAGSR